MLSSQYEGRFVRMAVVCLALAGACTGNDERELGVTRAALLGVADCPAGHNVIVGTTAGDVINGTEGNDCIVGLAGNDVITGLGGDDVLIGGAGGDRLYGSAGDDVLYGEDGNDRLEGDGGSDIIDGGAGNDRCSGGDGNDVMTGGADNDTLSGNAGDDFIADTSGTNNIDGGNGSDSCSGVSCELAAPAQNGCTVATQCGVVPETCIADVGMCVPCGTAFGVGCNDDDCPSDPNKKRPGICGCGVADTDSDGDGVADCNDVCPGFDDAIDTDADGTPDDCESEPPPGPVCAPGASGPGVYDGELVISSEGGQVTVYGIVDGAIDESFPNGLSDLTGIECVTGSVQINTVEVTDVSALTLRMIGGGLYIFDTSLVDLDGLEELISIQGQLAIAGNTRLLTLRSLNKLTSLAAGVPASFDLLIFDNEALHPCWVTALEAQTSKACGASFIGCSNNNGTIDDCSP